MSMIMMRRKVSASCHTSCSKESSKMNTFPSSQVLEIKLWKDYTLLSPIFNGIFPFCFTRKQSHNRIAINRLLSPLWCVESCLNEICIPPVEYTSTSHYTFRMQKKDIKIIPASRICRPRSQIREMTGIQFESILESI